MRLSNFLKAISICPPASLKDDDIQLVTADSRQCGPKSVFIAVKGTGDDGHLHIPQAIQKGAQWIIGEQQPSDCLGAIFFQVPDSRKIWSDALNVYYDNPSKQLHLIGVTGTNGKTTTAFLIQHLLQKTMPCALMGTVGYDTTAQWIDAVNTTPSIEVCHRFFKESLEAGAKACAMEVSSHALDQKRTLGLNFQYCVFTNLTQDHLDYHGSFENYYQAKKRLFDDNPDAIAIVNSDDTFGQRLLKEIKNKKVTYGITSQADYVANHMTETLNGVSFDFSKKGKAYARIQCGLVGQFNVLNILSTIVVADSLGISLETITDVLKHFPGVPGRLEAIRCGQLFDVFVDYAHTPDAVENVVKSIRHLTQGRLIVLLGCGGDRDKEKRPLMARAGAAIADKMILTSDNPRSEDPLQIIKDMQHGLTGKERCIVEVEVDRREAIEKTLQEGKSKDVVLILGKGHENYQMIGALKQPLMIVRSRGNF